MVKLIRLVNVYYTKNGKRNKESFKTFLDSTTEQKKHYLEVDGERLEMTKEQGNEYYQFLKQSYSDLKAITVIGINENNVSFIRVNEHYEVRVGGEFYCSEDTLMEARERKNILKELLRC